MEFLQDTARQIVKVCLQISKGDMVTINSWHHTQNLAEEIALECYRVGAVPQITFMSDNLWFKLMSEVPAENLSTTPLHILKGVDGETACINLHGPEKPDPKHVKDENLEANRKASKPIVDREDVLKVRILDVYLGKATPKRAETYGLDYDKWFKVIVESIRTDHTRIRALGKRIAEVLLKGKNVPITNECGTELRLRLERRRPFINDGVIDSEDVETGRTQSMLPAGSVDVAPRESSAEGTIVFDTPHYSLATKIESMKWTFEKGVLVEIEASDILKEFLEESLGHWKRVGKLRIGLNPAIEPPCIFDQLARGAVSIGVGYDKDLGGTNDASPWQEYSATLTKATLKVDNKTLIENGVLKAI